MDNFNDWSVEDMVWVRREYKSGYFGRIGEGNLPVLEHELQNRGVYFDENDRPRTSKGYTVSGWPAPKRTIPPEVKSLKRAVRALESDLLQGYGLK